MMRMGLQDVRLRITDRSKDQAVCAASLVDYPGESVLIGVDLLHKMDLPSKPGFEFTIRGNVTHYDAGRALFFGVSPRPDVFVSPEWRQ